MAKIIHNNYHETVEELFTDAVRKGVLHLTNNDEYITGNTLNIHDRELLNFGTCGYLGLELDERLKQGAIDFTQRFGTQYSVSRTYVTSKINVDLEELLFQIYKHPLIVYPSTSACHISVIPILVHDQDAVILDQQVHVSVQTATQLLRQKGVTIEMIRHSNLEMLERKIQELAGRHQKIWYMVDGVYSMYGDVVPIHDIIALMDKYEQLHLYVDDCHGMSWAGKNGCGYIFGEVGLHPRMILNTTLAKGFGAVGGIAIFPTQEMMWKVKIHGGPLSYSHPLPPPVLGAAIASAKIHLSDEIHSIQHDLKQKLDYCNMLLEQAHLPVISNPATPIYFIGMRQPKVGYNMVKRIINEGFYVNISIFPVVPVKNTGLRFTVNRHVRRDDIKSLVDAMAYHYPKALEEEGCTDTDVRKAFKLSLPAKPESTLKEIPTVPSASNFVIQHETSIEKIDKKLWNSLLADNGAFDWDALKLYQESYSGNDQPEDNWDFHYFIIKDQNNKPILATYATVGIYKDDLLAPYSISQQIEERRKTDPYWLTSKTLALGSLLTEGIHLYLDKTNTNWHLAFKELLNLLYAIQEKSDVANVILRDFDADDLVIKNFLIDEGFFKIDMPNSNVIKNISWGNGDEYWKSMSKKNRAHLRTDVYRYADNFEIEFKSILSENETDIFYNLYTQTKDRNLSINYFPYCKKLFQLMSIYNNWEFMVIRLKSEKFSENPIVSIMACCKSVSHYALVLIGMDYKYAMEYKVYKQSLYQAIMYGRSLGYKNILLGLTADIEKKKLGAVQLPRVAYVQAKDNYNFEVIESMAVMETK